MPSHAIDGAGIRRYRITVRARLALTYSALLTGAGVVMMGIVYLVMRYVPTYEFASTTSEPAQSGGTVSPMDLASPPVASPPLEPPVPATPLDPAHELLINSP